MNESAQFDFRNFSYNVAAQSSQQLISCRYFPDISSGTVYFHKKEHGKLYYRLVYEDSEYRHDVAEKTRGLDGVVQTTIGTRTKTPVVAPAVAKLKQTSSAGARRGSRLKYVCVSVCGRANPETCVSVYFGLPLRSEILG